MPDYRRSNQIPQIPFCQNSVSQLKTAHRAQVSSGPGRRPPLLTEHITTKTNRLVTFSHRAQRLQEKRQAGKVTWRSAGCLCRLANLRHPSEALGPPPQSFCLGSSHNMMGKITRLTSCPVESSVVERTEGTTLTPSVLAGDAEGQYLKFLFPCPWSAGCTV